MLLAPPTLSGSARNRGTAECQDLWEGLRFVWSPEVARSQQVRDLAKRTAVTQFGLTLSTMAQWSQFGRAIDFNGTASRVTTSVAITGSSPRTVFAVVDVDTLGDRKFLASGNGLTNGGSFSWTVETAASSARVLLRHGGGNIRYGAGLTGWFTFSATVPVGGTTTDNVQVWINGEFAAGTRNAGSNQTLATTSAPFSIGWDALAGGNYFDGRIGLVAIWDRAKSARQHRRMHRDALAVLRARRQVSLLVPEIGGGGGGTTYNETASGGAVGGGSASVSATLSEVAAGGAVGAGASAVSAEFTISASGGAIGSGTATVSGVTTYSETGSGGAVGGSTALVSAAYSLTGSGGGASGGVAAVSAEFTFGTAGGATAGGSATVDSVYTGDVSGGAVGSGSAAVSGVYALTASGGAVAGGASAAWAVYTITATGGAVGSGTATVTTGAQVVLQLDIDALSLPTMNLIAYACQTMDVTARTTSTMNLESWR